jgi:imidazolonepropionase-like amidohydrolase
MQLFLLCATGSRRESARLSLAFNKRDGQTVFSILAETKLLMPNGHRPPTDIAIGVLFSLIALLLFTPLTTPAQRSALDTYAITNARIVTLSGPIIERGTIVIRNGLVEAVGGNTLSAPPDARIVDGTGLTVYPGLIDANTNLGVPQSVAPTQAFSRGGAAVVAAVANQAAPQSSITSLSPNSTQPPGLQPEILAADLIRPGGDQIEAARNAGVTSALTVPREGILIGQSAFINLAGDTPQQMLVRTPVALHIGFTPLRTGSYPASVLGVFSALRQMFLDAVRLREMNQLYERNPRGLRRPEQDKSLIALQPALMRQMPVVMYANTEREIERALDLAQEFNLRIIIAGGAEAWRVTNRLRAMDVPVLLSLNFPRRTTASSAEADPDPLRVLRERVNAPKTAARLAAAGVRFAFQSGALANMTDFLNNARLAVENGLARDEALRALTIRPAEIFNVADRTGSIEPGKIANLTITRGDLFDRNARLTHVFIDGRPVDLKPVVAAIGGAAGAGIAAGTWSLSVNFGEGDLSVTLLLQQEGEQLRGSIQGALGSAQIANASVGASGDIRFTAPVTLPNATQTTEAAFTGTISGNQMRGTVQVVGRAAGSFTGTRPGRGSSSSVAETSTSAAANPTTPPQTTTAAAVNLTGTWNINVAAQGQNIPVTVTLQQQGTRLTGSLQSQLGSAAITTGSVTANNFRFSATVTIGGETVDVVFNGSVSGNQMTGMATTAQGAFPFSGTRPQEN